jgi:hypothetical protein
VTDTFGWSVRRQFAAIIAFLIIFSTMGLAAAKTVEASHTRNCETPLIAINEHAGVNVPMQGSNTRGISSDMGTVNRIEECFDSNNTDPDAGPSYWVALVPSSGGSSSQIIQIGVIECEDVFRPSTNPCASEYNSTPRWFWAVGGCNNIGPTPRDLGPASTASQVFNFRITRAAGGWYNLTIKDPATGNSLETVSWNSASDATDCWLPTDTVRGQVSCERWDGGDGCGEATNKVLGNNIHIQTSVAGTWYSSQLTNSWCFEDPEMQCSVPVSNGNDAQFWTVQN